MKGLVSQHMHRRARSKGVRYAYPAREAWVRLLDKVAVASGIIGPLMTFPQIWQIYYYRNATGVSVLSWAAFSLLDVPFVLYGAIHRNRLILVTYLLWTAVNLTVVIGAIIYR